MARGELRLSAPDTSLPLRLLVDLTQKFNPFDRPSFRMISGIMGTIHSILPEHANGAAPGDDPTADELDKLSQLDDGPTASRRDENALSGTYDSFKTQIAVYESVFREAGERAIAEAGGDIMEP